MRFLQNRCLHRALLAGAVALFAPMTSVPAWAEAPLVKTQVPGYYRTMLGEFEVTALFDGAIDLDVTLLTNAQEVDLQRLLARMFVGSPKMQTAVNAYLINTGRHLVLVDAGAAGVFGPTLGYVLPNLKAAGYEPAQVDAVIVTHLHGDHVGGLTGADGQPVFPNARILVAKAESDYWLSQATANAAPADRQMFFKMARDVAAPYQARGLWKTFVADEPLVPGIRAVATVGHTPGHTAFEVESKGQKLLIWGDLVHSHAVQFARPRVSFEFDVDPKQAIATRLAVMKAVAGSKDLVAGMHLPFPGIGHVREDGEGTYSWVPVEFGPLK